MHPVLSEEPFSHEGRAHLPFIPTCSQYAAEAIQRHGALCGGALALWRLMRCNPLFKGGLDPVPEENPFTKPFHKKATKKENH